MKVFDTNGRLVVSYSLHAAEHEAGGTDEVNIAGLGGESAELAAHKGVESQPIHGSTVVATAEKLVHRDAAGRARIANPAVDADIDNQGSRNTAIATHAAIADAHHNRSHDHSAAGDGSPIAEAGVPNHMSKNKLAWTANRLLLGAGAAANPTEHEPVSAATAERIVIRDAASRAQVANPAVDADIDTKGARDTAIGTHAALTSGVHGAGANTLLYSDHNAVLSTTVHNNNNYCILYGNENRSGLPRSSEFTGGTPGSTKVPTLVAIEDPLGKYDSSDWYGASGAYIQADADSSATKIEDDDADFPASIYNTIVKWASNAAGTLNTGVGVITRRDNAATLTIYKCTGADFAASYYYWIKHSEWEIPVTGLYLVEAAVLYLPAEIGMPFQSYICYFRGTSHPVLNSQANLFSPVANYCMPFVTTICNFTAGDRAYLGAYHTGTSGTPTLFTSDPSHIRLRIFLLKQTA